MRSFVVSLVCLCACFPFFARADQFETDTVETSAGPLRIGLLGRSSLLMEFNDRNIYVDPFGEVADFSQLPKADIILITHGHHGNFDPQAIDAVRTDNTLVVLPEFCASKYKEGIVMRNEDVKIVLGLKIEGVPAYNVVHRRASGFPYHPRGIGNGYIVTFGDKRVYIAGDTEKIPEMQELTEIDIAFLPVSVPHAMSVEMAADAVKTIRPRIFYPYHCDDTDLSELLDLLGNQSDTEVRVRNAK